MSEAERERFLLDRCKNDPVLREEVSRLLAADSASLPIDKPPTSPLPRFGLFQAERLLGRGGMGVVYLVNDTSFSNAVTLNTALNSTCANLATGKLGILNTG